MIATEHEHVLTLLLDYDRAIFRGEYSPILANVTIDNGTVTLRLVVVEDLFPVPANWGGILVALWNGQTARVPVPENATVYADGTRLAVLERPTPGYLWLRNSSLTLPLTVNQELRIPDNGSFSTVRLEDGVHFVSTVAVHRP